ncbi:hypothetical protein RHSIM_Rhsim09G0161700 [Rhododendron simsii]|uniref:DUF674 domain-containing protein n=1 Tax=Rhododendron simsii TaxID=118357 RepID=A0A834GJI4_RHOSS|nr:hypothetical protein RHSIM_Rhsim09G0161700 [Rhododendron simsii]
MASSKAKVTLKLLIDTKSKRVLFAEAGKDFVDFLFHLLRLPVGTVVKLLTTQTMVGTLGNLYESIENLNETYFQPNATKLDLLNPKPPTGNSSDVNPLFLLNDVSNSIAKKFFVCPNYTGTKSHMYVSDVRDATCPRCNDRMSKEMAYVTHEEGMKEVKLEAGEGGFVKGVVTYMVMDDLVVTPMSTISGITILNKFNVKDAGALKDRVGHFGMPEPNQSKEVLLKPKAAVCSTEDSLLLTGDDAPAPAVKKAYKGAKLTGTVTDGTEFGSYISYMYFAYDPKATCPLCSYTMSTEVTFVPPKVANTGLSGEGGYVKGVVTPMVMDNLVVMPMSTISGIALLSKCNVKNVASLEEKVVSFGMDEGTQSISIVEDMFNQGLKLLKATLHSNMALTSVFLGENIIKEQKRIQRRVAYCVTKLEDQFGAPYFSEGEEEDPTYVPDSDEEEEADEDEEDEEDEDDENDD